MEYEPYINAVVSEVVEITDEYILLNDIRISRYVDNNVIIFGRISTFSAVETQSYRGGGVYGAYYPNSNVIKLLGVGGKDGMAFMRDAAKTHHKNGQWSTGHYMHTFRHELGHALQKHLLLTDVACNDKIKRISEIRDSIFADITDKFSLTSDSESDIIKKDRNEYKRRILSRYGLDADEDIDEFISECIAEYVNGKPRNTAKEVVEILLSKE